MQITIVLGCKLVEEGINVCAANCGHQETSSMWRNWEKVSFYPDTFVSRLLIISARERAEPFLATEGWNLERNSFTLNPFGKG